MDDSKKSNPNTWEKDLLAYLGRITAVRNQLLASNVVLNAATREISQEDIEEFNQILNQVLPDPNNPVEYTVDSFFKKMYFAHRGIIRPLQREKNSRPDQEDLPDRSMRQCVLLSIGLEIVRELGIEKLIHINWNQSTREYEVGLANTVEPTRKRGPKKIRRNDGHDREIAQLKRELLMMRNQVAGLRQFTPPPTEDDSNVVLVTSIRKSWAEMASPDEENEGSAE